MKKRVLCLILAAVLVMGMVPVSTQAAELVVSDLIGPSAYFYIYDNGLFYVGGTGVTSKDYPVYNYIDALPNRIVIGEGITHIGEQTFNGSPTYDNVTSVKFPDSLRSIGYFAFPIENLASIEWGNGIETIGKDAFVETNLTSIVLPDSVKTIDDCAFYGNEKLKSVTLGKGVAVIGNEVFMGCPAIESIVIPDNVTSMGKFVFKHCDGLTSAKLGSGLTAIPEGCFYGCAALSEVVIAEGTTNIGCDAFSSCTSLSSVVLPNSVTTIEHGAFGQCASLEQVVIPEGVKTIEAYAFIGTGLKEVYIPKSVETIGESAFFVGYDSESITIYGYRETEAQRYAKENYYKFVALDGFGLDISIADSAVLNGGVTCGTVTEKGSPVSKIQTGLTVVPDEDCSQVAFSLTLPEGFSFDPHTPVTETDITVGDVTEEVIVPVPDIYPIYLNPASVRNSYELTVNVSGLDSAGDAIEGAQKCVFFNAQTSTDRASNLGDQIKEKEYVFSLNSAYGSGTVYNKETAKLGALLSDMAYKEGNLRTFLVEGLGFSDFRQYNISNNNKIECGSYIAHKKLLVNGQIKNLVYVVIRGTSSIPEWISNVKVDINGMMQDHVGFNGAAFRISANLMDYCKRNGFTKDDTLFLVTGHSKGAAAANLLGHWLNTGTSIAKKSNVSVYTFATPTVNKYIISEAAGYKGHENIFNFVNYQDAIRNAPSMKFYGRYGSTTIFAFSTGTAGTTSHNDGYGKYSYIQIGSNVTSNEAFNAILYDAHAGDWLSKAQVIFKVFSGGRSAFKLGELLNAHSMNVYYNAVCNDAPDASFAQVNARTEEVLQKYNQFLQELSLGGSLPGALVHMFKCPIDLYVENGDGVVVASIVDGEATCEAEDLQVYLDGETLVVTGLEEDLEKYTIRVEGYDVGNVNHVVQSIDADGIQSAQVRKQIPISKGESLEVGQNNLLQVQGEDPQQTQQAYDTMEDEEQILGVLEEIENASLVNPFEDVQEDDFFYMPVLWAYNSGITTGKDADHFNPTGACTRAQVVTFLWRAAGEPEPYSQSSPFPDVPMGKYYTKAVLWAVEQGITSGYKNGTFGPDNSCTRDQIVTFLWRYFGQPEPAGTDISFPDAQQDKFYYNAVLWAAENGITGGFKDGTFGPARTCTRDQIVTFLYRAIVD